MNGFWAHIFEAQSILTGDGTMVTYAEVRYTDLDDYVWVVCVIYGQ